MLCICLNNMNISKNNINEYPQVNFHLKSLNLFHIAYLISYTLRHLGIEKRSEKVSIAEGIYGLSVCLTDTLKYRLDNNILPKKNYYKKK